MKSPRTNSENTITLTELNDAKILQDISTRLIGMQNIDALYNYILDASIALLNSDMASIQILYPDKNELFLLAWKEFDPRSAKYWQWVKANSSTSCAIAMAEGRRIIIPDVDQWEEIKGTEDLEHFHLSGIKAVQSTPLLSRSGELLGMISNHWRCVYNPPEDKLALIDVLARQAADLIEHRKSEAALRKSEEVLKNFNTQLEKEVRQRTEDLEKNQVLLESIFNSALCNTAVIEAVRDENNDISDFRFILLNQVKTLYKGESRIGKLQTEVHPTVKDNGIFDRFTKVLETGGPEDFEVFYNGEGISAWLRIKAVKLEKERIVYTAEDITFYKQAEMEITALNQTLKTKKQELENVYYELAMFNSISANNYKETLHSMYTNMEFLATNEAQNLSNGGRANIRKTQALVQSLKLLTEDIIAFSNLSNFSKDKELTDLNTMLEKLIYDLLSKAEKGKINISKDTLPSIKGYSLLLHILFSHLLDNSFKFRKKDGDTQVSISHSIVELPGSNFSYSTRHHRISVTDNGIGFEPAESSSIFNIFYRIGNSQQVKGSGIGLAVCKKIMDLHEGIITAEGKPGEGATIHCYFPVIHEETQLMKFFPG